jgi:hypothetical protein
MAEESQTAKQPDKTDVTASVPEVIQPSERASKKLRLMDFIKDTLPPILITGGGYAAGFLAGRFGLKNEWAPKQGISHEIMGFLGVLDKEGNWRPGGVGGISAWAVGIYEAYRHWSKSEKQRLGIENIRQDIYNVSPPAELQAQAEQNSRIQDGIQKILSTGPQESHSSAVTDKADQPKARTV